MDVEEPEHFGPVTVGHQGEPVAGGGGDLGEGVDPLGFGVAVSLPGEDGGFALPGRGELLAQLPGGRVEQGGVEAVACVVDEGGGDRPFQAGGVAAQAGQFVVFDADLGVAEAEVVVGQAVHPPGIGE